MTFGVVAGSQFALGADATVNAIVVFLQIFLGIFQIVVRLAFVLLSLNCDAGKSLF